MEKYYFTFGSWDRFPYRNTYLIVAADSYADAVEGFREKHPDKNPGCMNCSGCYCEEQWKRVGKYYADRKPAEIIWTKNCFGQRSGSYDDLFRFVPEMRQIVRISEGTGDNQHPEALDYGYVDCIYYDQYELSNGMPEVDGGQVLLKEMLRDKYQCMADCIPDVLDLAYGNCLIDCIVL